MKKITAFLLAMMMTLPLAVGCKKPDKDKKIGPVFDISDDKLETFSNHLIAQDNIGDPFIMRYDGKYYLYPSTSSNTPYYVYVSEDLVHWSDKIVCVPESEVPSGTHENGSYCESLPAYAPEVTYFNGQFVMVTSPGGTGHRFFVSDSPTGPFKLVGGNFARKIDGHIFIDNDGKWYFYSANGAGIKLYEMTSPTTITNEMGTLSQINKKWTEGPMVVYHDGIYYMTYTGNHVHNISYRIPYSVSTTSPCKFYEPEGNNLLLISTKGQITAPGHSSSVKAPNLDAYYIVYHSHKGNKRTLNIDRIMFDGETMDVFGPTTANQTVPEMPDIYSFFESKSDAGLFEDISNTSMSGGRVTLESGKMLITKDALEGDKYTLEITTANIENGGSAGAVFAYSDANNYATALFNSAKETLVVTFVENGKATVYEKALVRSFDTPYDFSVVQSIQVEKSGNTFTFCVNDRELCKYESNLSGTKVGLFAKDSKAAFGYLGAADEVHGSSNCDFYKPVGDYSGSIAAHLCREKDKVTLGKDKDQSSYVIASEDISLNYRVYAAQNGKYTFGIKYRSTSDSILEIYVNGVLDKTVTLPTTDGEYTTVSPLGGITLSEGKNVITVYMKTGSAELKSYNVLLTAAGNMSLDFSESVDKGLVYTDGMSWEKSNGAMLCRSIGKRTYGSLLWSDYTYMCTVTPGDKVDLGLLVRTKNAAETNLFQGSNFATEHSVDSSKGGADWMQGYYIHLTSGKIALEKCNYSNTELASKTLLLTGGKKYQIGVVCVGANIQVYIDGELFINYTDPDPFLTGAVGVRLSSGVGKFDDLKVEMIEEK